VLLREVSLLREWGETEFPCAAPQDVLLSRLCLNIFESTLSSDNDVDSDVIITELMREPGSL
jgi:hypothetical protein